MRTLAGPAALACCFLAAGCLNGSASGPSSSRRVIGAGYSFGFCLGACQGELVIADASLSYRVSSRSGELLSTTRGELTASAVTKLAAIAAALPEQLRETYGCPDCADGGAAFVLVETDVRRERAEYEYGSPPPELASLDALMKSVMASLAECRASADVVPANPCTPSGR